MVLRIRLARHGRTGAPFYWIVLAESTSRRDGKYIRKFGTYNPLVKDGPKHALTDLEGLKKYISCGAQMSDPVARILKNDL